MLNRHIKSSFRSAMKSSVLQHPSLSFPFPLTPYTAVITSYHHVQYKWLACRSVTVRCYAPTAHTHRPLSSTPPGHLLLAAGDFRIQKSSRCSMTSTAPHLHSQRGTSQLSRFKLPWKTCVAAAAGTALKLGDVLISARSRTEVYSLDSARPPRIKDLVADVLVSRMPPLM